MYKSGNLVGISYEYILLIITTVAEESIIPKSLITWDKEKLRKE